MSTKRITTLQPLPLRPVDGHKGTFGRVLVVGGQTEMFGAPILSGTATLRMGSGLVQIATPADVLSHCLSFCPELIGVALSKNESVKRLINVAQLADAIVVGPGMGVSSIAAKRVRALVELNKPMVIDADALNILAMGKSFPKRFAARAVLTPHPGEMRRLGKLFNFNELTDDQHNRIDCAIKAAKAFKQIIVLKGHQTIVTDGSQLYINHTGDNTLAKAGTGDVLSGIIGSLLGQQVDPFNAACSAVWIHGKAGELAGQQLGKRSALARDVIDHIPAAIAQYELMYGS